MWKCKESKCSILPDCKGPKCIMGNSGAATFPNFYCIKKIWFSFVFMWLVNQNLCELLVTCAWLIFVLLWCVIFILFSIWSMILLIFSLWCVISTNLWISFSLLCDLWFGIYLCFMMRLIWFQYKKVSACL